MALRAGTLRRLVKTLRFAVKWKGDRLDALHDRAAQGLQPRARFYEFADYGRLVDAARALDARTLLIILLGRGAGLRASEMIGLRGEDVDLRRGQLVIERAIWRGVVDSPKSGQDASSP